MCQKSTVGKISHRLTVRVGAGETQGRVTGQGLESRDVPGDGWQEGGSGREGHPRICVYGSR